MECVIETKTSTILQFIQGLRGVARRLSQTSPLIDVIFEKLHQHRRVRLRLQHMRLPFECALLRGRQNGRE